MPSDQLDIEAFLNVKGLDPGSKTSIIGDYLYENKYGNNMMITWIQMNALVTFYLRHDLGYEISDLIGTRFKSHWTDYMHEFKLENLINNYGHLFGPKVYEAVYSNKIIEKIKQEKRNMIRMKILF